jgi:hypothetical protein
MKWRSTLSRNAPAGYSSPNVSRPVACFFKEQNNTTLSIWKISFVLGAYVTILTCLRLKIAMISRDMRFQELSIETNVKNYIRILYL